ncbi:MAG: 50S ribosomal protein L11 methyltransferase [Deltaproteobacteria bacterium]|nr:50S ribosomal protein L11 methyltransferase [Deltaproteobacteria bacterium]
MSGRTEPTSWLELIVQVGAADVDDVAALIASEIGAASAGTEQRGDEVVFWVSVEDSAAALTETRDAVMRWHAAGLAVDPAKVRLASALPELEWRDAWKKYFRVSKLTRQFVVVPSWESYPPLPGEVVIDLDPGMAFGTGTHASTRLVLEELQALADGGVSMTRILDVGCGSGILAIAAVKRWPGATCTAIDNDPIAIDATHDNAAVNRVADRIAASTGTLRELDEEFPLVLANIQAHVLRELRADLIARTAPGGTLILSGLLTPQAEPLAQEFVAAGMRCVRVRPSTDDPQWSAVTLAR